MMKAAAPLACVILAAGAGTRMKSSIPKVLHPIFERPMLHYPLDAALGLRPSRVVVVTGKQPDAIKEALKSSGPKTGELSFAVQDKLLGTAHALSAATPLLKGFKKSGIILVLNGDVPLVTTGTLKKFIALHRKNGNAVSFISFVSEEPSQYGRVLRDKKGGLVKIIEQTDVEKKDKSINEFNSGVYALEAHALPLLKEIKRNKIKGEYYLTDLIGIALKKGLRAEAFPMGDESEFMGVNTRAELASAHGALRDRLIRHWLDRGVNFVDTGSVFIEPSVRIGPDTLIYPNVYLHGKTVIGRRCTIYPNVRIVDSRLKDGTVIRDSTLVEGSVVGPDAGIGPFAHIRPGCNIGSAKIGNFVEAKKAAVGDGAKAMHLSYLGDASIGKGVNIGAGTITCNYDGMRKHRTVIGDGVFVGSDSQLVAPVRLGKGSYIGAGSTITRNVPPGALAVSRTKQKNVEGWASRKKTKMNGNDT